MNKLVAGIFALLFCLSANAQITKPEVTEVWEPEPRVVTPGNNHAPPSDAIVLFDGTNVSEWTNMEGGSPGWKIEDGVLTVVKGTGDIKTRRNFGDVQLHLEWRSPEVIEGEGQGRGNSGLFFQEKYEVQILDSYQNRTYSNGQAGAIYKQYPPLVNACRPPGEWQTYDVIFIAPRFNKDGMRVSAGQITVFHNGVLIHHAAQLQGTTEYIGMPKNKAHGPGPIKLQDHSNPVSYRNIWVREL
jgi:hypothetical protein